MHGAYNVKRTPLFVRNLLPSVHKKLFWYYKASQTRKTLSYYTPPVKPSNVILIISSLSQIDFQSHILSSDFLTKVIYFLICSMRFTYATALLLLEISSILQTLVFMTLAVFADLCIRTAVNLSLHPAIRSQVDGGSRGWVGGLVKEYVHIFIDMQHEARAS